MKKYKKFTLIELLIVVAIIAILAAILLPSLSKAKEKAREVVCFSNMRQMGMSFVMFAGDHDGRIPANGDSQGTRWEGTEDWQRSWMGNEIPLLASKENHEGLLVTYMGGREGIMNLYRCPSLSPGPRWTYNSNGQFDYVSPMRLSGAMLDKIPTTADFPDGTEGPIPMILEEDPLTNLNSRALDPGHASYDQMGTWHRGDTTGIYVTIDVSVNFKESAPRKGPRSDRTYITLSDGSRVRIGDKVDYGTGIK
jgi:prepilin-type N-terminal cleavage/methylation domain-containing protein